MTAFPRRSPESGTPERAQAEALLQRGLDFHENDDFAQALTYYRQAVEADPTFALAHNNCGMVLVDLERFEEAIESLKCALTIDPHHAEAYNNLGFVLRRLGQDREAAACYERFLELEPEVEEAPKIRQWLALARAQFGEPVMPDLTPLSPLPGLTPKRPERIPQGPFPARGEEAEALHLGDSGAALGSKAGTRGEESEATRPGALLRQAEAAGGEWGLLSGVENELPPSVLEDRRGRVSTVEAADELCERGLDRFAAEDYEGAAQAFRDALDIDPGCAAAHAGLGKAQVRLEHFEEGLASLVAAIELNPEEAGSYYVLGYALRRLGREAEAVEAYEKFLELVPEAEEGEQIREWVAAARAAGAPEEAEPAPTASGEVAPADSEAVAPELAADPDAAIPEEAKEALQDALQRFQDGNSEGALRQVERLRQSYPGYVGARVLLGRILVRLRQYHRALEVLREALALDPGSAEAHYFSGQAQEKLGERERAKSAYESCIQLAPDGPRAERLREWLDSFSVQPQAQRGVQCDRCLRYHGEEDLCQYENEPVCRYCLQLIEAETGEALVKRFFPEHVAELRERPQVRFSAAPAAETQRRTKRRGLAAVLALAFLAGACAALWQAGYFGGSHPPPQVSPTPTAPAPTSAATAAVARTSTTSLTTPDRTAVARQFDPKQVTFEEWDPPRRLVPFVPYQYTGRLGGTQGRTVRVELQKGPQGMTVEPQTGTISWQPPVGADLAAWAKGFTAQVAVVYRVLEAERELWRQEKLLELRGVFGFQKGVEFEVGADAEMLGLLVSSADTGMAQVDLFLAGGRSRRGQVLHLPLLMRGEIPPGIPVELAGGRFRLGAPVAAVAAETTGDDLKDLVVADWQCRRVLIIPKLQSGRMGEPLRVEVPAAVCDVAVGDLNGDDLPDLATAHAAAPFLAVHLQTRPGEFQPAKVPPLADNYGARRLSYLPGAKNKGGRILFVSEGGGSGAVQVFGCKNGRTLERLSGASRDWSAPLMCAKVFLGPAPAREPLLGVLFGGEEGQLVLLRCSAAGSFAEAGDAAPAGVLAVGGYPASFFPAELNGDGKPDLVVGAADQVRLFLWSPQGQVPAGVFSHPGLNGQVTVADVNKDGALDIISLTADNKVVVFASRHGMSE